jgi:hypothetical protein
MRLGADELSLAIGQGEERSSEEDEEDSLLG